MSDAITYTECVNCGTRIYLPQAQWAELQNSCATFYCRNGHAQSYRKPTWRKSLDEAHALAAENLKRAKSAEQELAMLRNERANTCTDCGKRFSGSHGVAIHRAKAHR